MFDELEIEEGGEGSEILPSLNISSEEFEIDDKFADYEGQEDPEVDEGEDNVEQPDEEDEDPQDHEEESEPEEVVFIEKAKELLGFDISAEDLEKHGSLKEAYEAKKMEYVTQVVQQELRALGEAEREAALRLLQGHPLEEVKEVYDTFNSGYSVEDLEDDPELCKKVIREAGKLKGLKDKEIDRMLKGTSEEELVEEAKGYLDEVNSLKEKKRTEADNRAKSKVQARQEAEKKAYEAINTSTDKFLEELPKFAPFVKLQEKTKAAIKGSVIDVLNEVYNKQAEYGPKLAFLKHLGVLDGDFSKITKAGAASESKKLAEVLKSKKTAPSTVTHKENQIKRPPKPFVRK